MSVLHIRDLGIADWNAENVMMNSTDLSLMMAEGWSRMDDGQRVAQHDALVPSN